MKILIVSPHFPPTNAADMQRVRLLLPYLSVAGIEAEVLAVGPEQVAAPLDAWLENGLPSEIPIHRVAALGLRWSKIPGLGTLSNRALQPLRKKGQELLGGKSRNETDAPRSKFDLVYFSTTQFAIHVLGPEWRRTFGVPFVMDYQDPWVNDYYREHPEVKPPGGRFKYRIASWMARKEEPRVLKRCSGITSVSESYPVQLERRYSWLTTRDVTKLISDSTPKESHTTSTPLPSLIIPFPGDNRDLQRVQDSDIHQEVFDPGDGKRHWIYVGRGGQDMQLAVRALFAAISDCQYPTSDLRLHFIGTSYAATGQGVKTIEPIADDYGLADIVEEHPDRIPYSATLRCLLDADALIIPGSDDPAYTASKIYPYLLAEKPLLAIFHEQSSVTDLMRRVRGGTFVSFRTGESPESVASRIQHDVFSNDLTLPTVPLDREAFRPNTAKEQARQLATFFRQCLKLEAKLK